MLLLGDFNAKSKTWFINDQWSREGTQLISLIWNETTNRRANSCSRKLFKSSTVHPSLHSKCHHQVIYAKLNLQIEYPPPYTRAIWDYGKAQFDLINEAIENFDWNKPFPGQDIHNQVNLFNTTILNIFQNFIPNKIILCDDKEPPPPPLGE